MHLMYGVDLDCFCHETLVLRKPCLYLWQLAIIFGRTCKPVTPFERIGQIKTIFTGNSFLLLCNSLLISQGKIIYLHPHCSCLGSKHVINSNHGRHDFWLICFGFNSIFVNRVFLMNKTFSIQLMAAIYQVGKLNLYGSWYHLLNYTRTSFSLFL